MCAFTSHYRDTVNGTTPLVHCVNKKPIVAPSIDKNNRNTAPWIMQTNKYTAGAKQEYIASSISIVLPVWNRWWEGIDEYSQATQAFEATDTALV